MFKYSFLYATVNYCQTPAACGRPQYNRLFDELQLISESTRFANVVPIPGNIDGSPYVDLDVTISGTVICSGSK